MDSILLLIRFVLFAIFALAAIGKFLDLKGSEKAVKDFGTPEEFAKVFAIAIPFAEIVFAFCFLFPSTSWVGAIGGLILLLSFTGGMIWQMAKGNAPDCHCFGQIHSEPVSPKSLARNIVFAILTLFLIAQGRDSQGPSFADTNSDSMQLILTFSVLALTGAALFFLKRVLDNQTQILRRLELLEVISREGVPLERNEIGHPHDGLPIGAPFPEFELPDTSGGTTTLAKIVESGRPSMFFFVSPTCEPCKALLPEIEGWEAELGDRVNFVFFSSGTAEANEGRFGAFSEDVILQEKREIAEMVQARWTPTALFITAEGMIGSRVAAGDFAIKELIERIRHADLSKAKYFIRQSENTENGRRPPRIGSAAPEFELKDIDGNPFTDDELRGKRTLAVFWSLTCPHCLAMMNELKTWDAERAEGDPDLVVFSDGPPEDHADLGLKAPIVLDAGYKTSAELGMFGTPSAVLFDESGTIVTETATGAMNIWALIGKRK